jgi:murein DD-endopeptidase MepM/ murein hydrolase activator NlpD
VIQDEINNIDQQITLYGQMIQEKETELAEAEEEEQARYELFCQRVRYMEEDGNVSYWSILFNAADFTDLLDRFTMVSEIMDYDNAVMDQLIAIREQIAQDKQELEDAKTGQEAAKAEQEAAKAELKAQEAEVDKLVEEIAAKEDEVESAIDDLESQAASMDKQIAALEKQLQQQLASSGTTITSESGYLWPLPGWTNLSSLCGGRTDPFTGKAATHSGIDIPASRGTAVKAAKSGQVITSTYNSGGYGQYVVISHGNGNTTLYAHMIQGSQTVQVGDMVTQGQVIGQVGTTGRSTGYHLHFEVRVNNSRIDPVTLFSGLTYKGSPIS